MSDPRRIRLLLEYDGTDFHGWQRQPGRRTVQGVLEAALRDLDPQASGVTGAGRTDAGCHAIAQVAHADVVTRLDAPTIGRALNARLRDDLRVHAVEDAALAFHARFGAISRRYEYRLTSAPHPLVRRSAYAPELGAIDVERVRAALPHLLGEQDFAAVGHPSENGGTTLCRIHEATFNAWADGDRAHGLRLSLVANRFLRGMVRTIVGTLLDVGRGRRSPEDVATLLASRDRRRAGAAVPAHGLCLMHVAYPDTERVFVTREGGET